MNPHLVEEREAAHADKIEEARLREMDPVRKQQAMDEMFREGQRTEHKGIKPARDRIKDYKVKTFKRSLISAMPSRQAASNRLLPTNPSEADVSLKDRPTTAAGGSQMGMSAAPTAATGGLLPSTSMAGSLAEKARAISLSRFSQFDETEKAVKKYNFPSFYTKGLGSETYEPTEYHKENRFEARGSYMVHKTSGLVVE